MCSKFYPENEKIMKETEISRIILDQYHNKLLDCLENDVVVVGAGPAGLAAGYYLAKNGVKTTVLEKSLSTGGGIWGGAAGYSIIIVEDKDILDEIGVEKKKTRSLYAADAIEFATALGYHTKRAGAEIFNLTEVVDLVLKENIIKGLVVTNTTIKASGLLIDPFCIGAKFIVDATGHSAEVVSMLKRKKADLHISELLEEDFMDVEKAEADVVEKTSEVYPGLYAAGMSVCSTFNLPRMGPIFSGMLKSGKKVAELINEKIKSTNTS
jgi:thiazole biosynthesis enzyme